MVIPIRSFFYQTSPNSIDNFESSPMEIDGEEEVEKKDYSNFWVFLQFLNNNNNNKPAADSHSKASLIYHGKESFKSSTVVADYKNKGVCIPSCLLIPLQSDKLDTSCSITEKGEPSTRFCVICNEPKPPKGMQQAGKCNHYFCIDCVKEYLMKKVKESGLPVQCPEKECKMTLPDYFNKFIPHQMMDRYYASQRMVKALASSSRYTVCPYNYCGSRFLDITTMKYSMFEWHRGMDCDQFQRLKKDEKSRK